MSGTLQESVLGQVLFNIFINGGIEHDHMETVVSNAPLASLQMMPR